MPTVDFYGDVNFVDGFVENSGTTWSTVHNAATGSAATVDTNGTNGQVQTFLYLGTTYYIRRGFYCWDTSSIGAGSTITAASFFIKLSNHSGAPLMNVVQGSQANANTLVTGDFDAFGTTRFSTDASNTNDGTYQEFVLNASGIAAIQKAGTTKFVLTRDNDIDNSAPSDFIYANYYGSRNATSSLRPYLRVEYTTPSGPANLKTLDGIAKASVKTINGIALASLKSYDGIV